MGKNKALAHHTSAYFHTRKCVDLTPLLSHPNARYYSIEDVGIYIVHATPAAIGHRINA